MNRYLQLSRGEAKDTGRARDTILANTFEALIGAIYMDQGYDMAKEFISKHLFHIIDEVVDKKLWLDAKSHFQEKAQQHEGVTPEYRTIGEEGPDHDKYFTVGVFLREEEVASGKGRSKQEAEQEAARKALEAKGWG
jgi:ribonuclease-3